MKTCLHLTELAAYRTLGLIVRCSVYRAFFVAALAMLVAGCVTVSNTLTQQQVTGFRLVNVDVAYAPDARIWWGDGEREFAATRGMAAHDADKVASTPEGVQYVRGRLTQKLVDSTRRNLAGDLAGSHPVRLQILVREVHISSPIQRILVGGGHLMKADVTITDAKTGRVLSSYPNLIASAVAGQGIVGAMVEHAAADAPIDRVVANFTTRYRKWLLGL